MKREISFYLKKRVLLKDKTVVNLAANYLEKAKTNIITIRILFDVQEDRKIREKLNVPKEYSTYEWVVITGYYAMYSAALALIAKIGFRSKNHAATILILEEFFVKKKLLDDSLLLLIRNAEFQKQEVEKLSEARHKREIA